LQFVVVLLYIRFLQNENIFLYFLFIQAELEQCSSPALGTKVGVEAKMACSLCLWRTDRCRTSRM